MQIVDCCVHTSTAGLGVTSPFDADAAVQKKEEEEEEEDENEEEEDEYMKILIAVFSAPKNYQTRSIVRSTWAPTMREYPGVEVVFFLGRDQDQTVNVSFTSRKKLLFFSD